MEKSKVIKFGKVTEASKESEYIKKSLSEKPLVLFNSRKLEEVLNKIEVTNEIVSDSTEIIEKIISDSKEILIESKQQRDFFKETFYELKGIANKWRDSYLDAHEGYILYSQMANILIDVITTNGLEEIIVPLIDDLKSEDEDMGEKFIIYEEKSYDTLIHEINTKWDFLCEE